MSSAVILKYFINSSAFPDFPNVSGIPILISCLGYISVSTSEIALPNPPIVLWSSIDINFFVSLADFFIISLSIGFIVCISITLTLIPFSFSISCAFILSATVTPVLKIVPSVPSPNCIAFPI